METPDTRPDPGNDPSAPTAMPADFSPAAIDRARQMLDAVPERIGRYRILERLGGGGMGEVYVAEQTDPIKRRVAVKVIKAGMDTRAVVARFEAERQALAMMDHPNIARVFDAGSTETGRPYFVMELVRGVPITKFCDENKLTTRQRVELLVPICQAVQHAHQKGIIHRDIKPHNVLVTLHDGVPVPKVIDFGIAKATSQPLTDKTVYTEFRQMIGTPAYMSPEQAEMSGLDIDTRSDIYSLGVLAYELLTGSPPFESDRLVKAGLAEIQRIIKEEDPPRPSLRLSTLGARLTTIAKSRDVEASKLSKLLAGELDWIVMRAMEKDRKRRYDTATDLAADFRRYLVGIPVIAAPPGAAYRLKKFVRKNRLPVFSASLIAATLLVSIVAISRLAFRLHVEVKNTTAALTAVTASDARERSARIEADSERANAESAARQSRYSAARSRALYMLGQNELENAFAAAKESYNLKGGWSDSLLLNQITQLCHRDWRVRAVIPVSGAYRTGAIVGSAPDGAVLLAAPGQIEKYDIATRACTSRLQTPNEWIKRFVPVPGGSMTVVAYGNKSLFIVDSANLKCLRSIEFSVNIAAVAASAKELLVTFANDTIRVINQETGEMVDSCQWPPDISRVAGQKLLKVAISPDGNTVVAGGMTYTSESLVWSRRTGTKRKHVFTGQKLQFLDNQILASFSYDIGGGPLESSHMAYEHEITDDAISTIRAFGVPVHDLGVNYFDDAVASTARAVFTSHSGCACQEMHGSVLKTSTDRYASILAHTIPAVQFSCLDGEGSRILVAFSNSIAVLSQAGSFDEQHWGQQGYSGMAVTRDATFRLMEKLDELDLQIQRGSIGQPVYEHVQLSSIQPTIEGYDTYICGIAVSEDGGMLAIRSVESSEWPSIHSPMANHKVSIYAIGHERGSKPVHAARAIVLSDENDTQRWGARLENRRILQFSRDGSRLLAGSMNSSSYAELYDTGSGTLIKRFASEPSVGPQVAGIPLSDSFVALAADRMSASICSLKDGSVHKAMGFGAKVRSICVSAEGKVLVTCTGTGHIRTIDLDSDRVLRDFDSALVPIAWSEKSDVFVALERGDEDPDVADVVLASRQTGKTESILQRGLAAYWNSQPAFAQFSPEADRILFETVGGESDTISRMSPTDAQRLLNVSDFARLLDESNGNSAGVDSNTSKPGKALTPLDASKVEELLPFLDRPVCLVGKIVRFDENERGYCRLFLAPDESGVVLYIPDRRTRAFMEMKMGGRNLDSYVGQTIEVSGQLTSFYGRLELVIDNVNQIRMEK